MKKICLRTKLLIGLAAFTQYASALTGTPVWTFTPLTPTTISVRTGDSAIVQYSVTNQSKKLHTLALQPIIGISQNTTPGNCSNPFTLGFQQSCTLTLQVLGSVLQGNVSGGPVVCQANPDGTPNPNQCYQPSPINRLNISQIPISATLIASVNSLALAVNGVARIITITNTSNLPAINVQYTVSPALPAGTSISPASCGTIAPHASCVLTITPGSVPSAAPGDTNPIPISLTINGRNTNTLTVLISILTYGSVYQSGYVFSIDDTTPITGSVGGKVAALTDQAAPSPNGIIWSSNGNGGTPADVDFFNIPGIYETSTNPPDACNGNSDGSCDTTQIVNHYAAVNLNFYAAGLCRGYTAGSFTTWYLPAICEMGYDTNSLGTGCGTAVTPTLQNMQSNLVDNGIGNLNGAYWSSTEFSALPSDFAWTQQFATGGLSSQFPDLKFGTSGVRCAHPLTV